MTIIMKISVLLGKDLYKELKKLLQILTRTYKYN